MHAAGSTHAPASVCVCRGHDIASKYTGCRLRSRYVNGYNERPREDTVRIVKGLVPLRESPRRIVR